MAVRKRTWKTKSGLPQEAWIVDYADAQGDRHIRTFERKKDADAFHGTGSTSDFTSCPCWARSGCPS
jgi:integrase